MAMEGEGDNHWRDQIVTVAMFGKDKQLLRASRMNFFIQNTVTLISLTSRSDRLLGFGVCLFGFFQRARFFDLRGLNNDDENSGSIPKTACSLKAL